MNTPLVFEWDDAKAQSNLAKHGVSFGDAIAIWADPNFATEDTSRLEDGERRSKAIGEIQGRLITAVYTTRGDTIRLISARRTNRREERIYGYR